MNIHSTPEPVVEHLSNRIWKSWEFARLIVSLLTPIAVVVAGWLVSHELDGNRRILDNRQKAYDSVRVKLNDIYCYVLYVGRWKEITPEQVLEYKRCVDQTIYSTSPFFESALMLKYRSFMHAVFFFETKGGGEVKIMTDSVRHRCFLKEGIEWQSARWAPYFVDTKDNRREVYQTYYALLEEFSKELGSSADYSKMPMPDYMPDCPKQ